MKKVLKIVGGIIVLLIAIFFIIYLFSPKVKAGVNGWVAGVIDHFTNKEVKENGNQTGGNNGGQAGAQPTESPKPVGEDNEQSIVDEEEAALAAQLLAAVNDLSEAERLAIYAKYCSTRELLWNSSALKADERCKLAAKKAGMKGKDPRMYDAVTYPFNAEDVESMRSELYDEICRNPVVGAMIVDGFHYLKLNGETLFDLYQDWTVPFWDKWQLGKTPAFTEKKEDTWFVTDEYVTVAANICTFLDQCTAIGVEKKSTKEFWYHNAELSIADIEALYSEGKMGTDSLPVLLFSIDRKTTGQAVLFGFNVCDKRLEIFTPGKKSPQTGPTSTPEPTSTPTPTSTPGPTETPKPTKDPGQSSMHQGHAPTGGGTQQGETPEKPTGDPAGDPSQGHQDPAQVTPSTTSTPTGQGSSPTPTQTDENPMPYTSTDSSGSSTPYVDPSTGQSGDLGEEEVGEAIGEPGVKSSK
jgi:hypothetical protein